MRRPRSAVFILAVICSLFWSASSAIGQGEPGEIDVAEPYVMATIFADEAGESHFGESNAVFALRDFAPPAPPISVSHIGGAGQVSLISSPPGWDGDWHPTPARQIVFCLTGQLEVEVSDGEVRRFGPGSAVMVEDTVGVGHKSRVIGTTRVYMVSVALGNTGE